MTTPPTGLPNPADDRPAAEVPLSPVDTFPLRQLLARALNAARHDYDHDDNLVIDLAAALNALVPVFQEAHGDLVAERDALSLLLRGMARRIAEVRNEMQFATRHIEQWQRVAQRLRSQRERARAELASCSTSALPDDAALAELISEYSHSCPYEPEGMQVRVVAEDEVRAIVRRVSAPATDPVPATPDGRVQWGVRVDGGSVKLSGTEQDAREWMAWTAKRATESTFELVARRVTDWQPVASQAPAEPPAAAKLFDRLITGASVVNGVPQTPAGPAVPEAATYRPGNKNTNNLYRRESDGSETHVGVTFNGLDGRDVVQALNANLGQQAIPEDTATRPPSGDTPTPEEA
jgi:hypothetical protein